MAYLPPNIYWDIYKRVPSGKTLINNYHYQDNEGNIYALPTTDMYFNSTFASLNGGTGVYGIYSKGELIYIGYTANGYGTSIAKALLATLISNLCIVNMT